MYKFSIHYNIHDTYKDIFVKHKENYNICQILFCIRLNRDNNSKKIT